MFFWQCNEPILQVLAMIAMTWFVPIMVFFTSIIGWQYFVGERTVKPGQCYVQYMDDAIFNCLLQVSQHRRSRHSMDLERGAIIENL